MEDIAGHTTREKFYMSQSPKEAGHKTQKILHMSRSPKEAGHKVQEILHMSPRPKKSGYKTQEILHMSPRPKEAGHKMQKSPICPTTQQIFEICAILSALQRYTIPDVSERPQTRRTYFCVSFVFAPL